MLSSSQIASDSCVRFSDKAEVGDLFYMADQNKVLSFPNNPGGYNIHITFV